MTEQIQNDVQKLEPGAVIELFELDTVALGGDRDYFHAYPQQESIWWQGTEYKPFPIKTSGFKRDADKPPTPTLTVGNVDGIITALCAYYDDMVGAKLTRRRTLAKFLDARNFSPIEAVAAPFWVADGITSSAPLKIDGELVEDPTVTAIHQTDWQGRVALSNQPRTQRAVNNTTSNAWSATPTSTRSAGSDVIVNGRAFTGSALEASGGLAWHGLTFADAPTAIVAGKTFTVAALLATDVGNHARIYVPVGTSAGSVTHDDLILTVNYSPTAASIVSFSSNRPYGTITNPAFTHFGTAVLFQAQFTFTPTAGSTFDGVAVVGPDSTDTSVQVHPLAASFVEEQGLGAFISNATANPLTVIDYSQTDTQIAFGQDPATGATLDWDGNGYNNPTADPDEEFIPEIWFINRKTNETPTEVEFELASALDLNGVQLPRRQIIANVCPWGYRSAECGYIGPPVADINDQPTTDPAKDQCGKRISSCKLRFGATNQLPYGGFPAADLMR